MKEEEIIPMEKFYKCKGFECEWAGTYLSMRSGWVIPWENPSGPYEPNDREVKEEFYTDWICPTCGYPAIDISGFEFLGIIEIK